MVFTRGISATKAKREERGVDSLLGDPRTRGEEERVLASLSVMGTLG